MYDSELLNDELIRKMDKTKSQLPDGSLVIFEAVYGSHLFGLASPESDVDIRGVFIPPSAYILGLKRIEQVKNKSNDIVYYSLGKFIKLLATNNPSIIELAYIKNPLYKHTLWDIVIQSLHVFISRKIKHTFHGYAYSQLSKINLHRKWLLSPPTEKPQRENFGLPPETIISKDQIGAFNELLIMNLERINDFHELKESLKRMGDPIDYRAIINRNTPIPLEIISSLVAADPQWIKLMFQEQSYQSQLKEWNDYEKWKRDRNPARAELERTIGYDAKHGMHLLRLLYEAEELLTTGTLTFPCKQHDYLWNVRSCKIPYDELLRIAEQLQGNTEHSINDALAAALRKMRYCWRDSSIIRSEQTDMLQHTTARPDILVEEPNVSPVAIEIEVSPALTVEKEAVSRLGKKMRSTGRILLSAIAIQLPVRIRAQQGIYLLSELEQATDIAMALYTGSDSLVCTRWPKSGWIWGGMADLSILVQLATIPPNIIENAVDQLTDGVRSAAGLLNEMEQAHPGAIHKISQELCQEDGEQTRRMAAMILINAFMFAEILAGGPEELANVSQLEQLRGADKLTKQHILAEWHKILLVNYWPIFDIARRIFEAVPATDSKPLIEVLAQTTDTLFQNKIMRSHDLTGMVFQRLIADRKFLAAYYTTPASASLLVGLAITTNILPQEKSWSSADDVKSLSIADFACGTGTLLSTAYQRVCWLHEIAGGDAEKLHPQMMATALVGCDVLPAAAHLTASMLAGAYPTVRYNQSSIFTVAYGKQPNGNIALGSLDLLDPQMRLANFEITSKAAEGMGETEKETWMMLPHAFFDLVIMNPPFTRATGHEGKKIGVPNPMFAAFSSSKEEQKLMAKATEHLTKGSSSHGNAGEASIFLVLADLKLKMGGMLALVMPLSLMVGDSWKKSRYLLSKNYSDLTFLSISGTNNAEVSFSADTGMGECLVVGQKSASGSLRATFVILNERPSSPLVGAITAEQIRRLITEKKLRQLEDGPVGGAALYFGDEVIGHALDAPLTPSGGWNLSRISDISLAQTAYQLVNEKKAWLPTINKSESIHVPMSTIASIGEIGPYHADINGNTATGGVRGPFDICPVCPNSVPSNPVLWAHDAIRERTMAFEADFEGIIRRGQTIQEQSVIDHKANTIRNTSSHCHFNRDFQFNSQSTGMQFTPRKTIGGRAWISISLASVKQEKVLVLWANTSLGLLLYWWHANKQQIGRGSIGKEILQTFPVLDVTALTEQQITEAIKIFDTTCYQHLLPIHEIDTDIVRKNLDEQFARNVLGLPENMLCQDGPLDILRKKLSREPTIRGSK